MQAYENLTRPCKVKPNPRLLVLQYNMAKRLRQELIRDIATADPDTFAERWEYYMWDQEIEFEEMASLSDDLDEVITSPALDEEIRELSGEEDDDEEEEDEEYENEEWEVAGEWEVTGDWAEWEEEWEETQE